MKHLDNEIILWESKNKQLLLTTHRLREVHKSLFGSSIKSIMLDELTSCELRTRRQFSFLRRATLYFLLINGTVFLLNQYLFKAELIKFFFGQFHIGPDTAKVVLYISVLVVIAYIALFFLSVKKVFSFYASNMTIDFQLRWFDFDERESFISKVEDAKNKRHRLLSGLDNKKAKTPEPNKTDRQ